MTALASAQVKGRMLKERSGELIAAVGGLEPAAAYCRVGKTTLARYYSQASADADCFMPIDVVRCLERVAGEAIVTAHLAMEADGAFVAVPQGMADGSDLLTLLAAQSRESSDLTAALCLGLADGRLCAAEARKARAEVQQLVRVAMQMDAELAVIMGEGR